MIANSGTNSNRMPSTFQGLYQFDQGLIIETSFTDTCGHNQVSQVQIYVTLDEDNYLHNNFTRYEFEPKEVLTIGTKYDGLDHLIGLPCHAQVTHKLNNTLEQVLTINEKVAVQFYRNDDSDQNIHIKIADRPEELKYQPTKLQQWKLKNPDTKYVSYEIQLNGHGNKEPFFHNVPWIYNNGMYIETEPPYTTLMFPQSKSGEFMTLYRKYKSYFPFCCY